MTSMARTKLILSGVALLVFVAGVRYDEPLLRWIAVGLLVAAFALRLYKPRG
jgi:hypothetical protein